MALELRGECERCHKAPAHDDKAYISVSGCMLCPACAMALPLVGPDCGGLVRRPRPRPRTVACGQAAA